MMYLLNGEVSKKMHVDHHLFPMYSYASNCLPSLFGDIVFIPSVNHQSLY
jgi:hypothetical protein